MAVAGEGWHSEGGPDEGAAAILIWHRLRLSAILLESGLRMPLPKTKSHLALRRAKWPPKVAFPYPVTVEIMERRIAITSSMPPLHCDRNSSIGPFRMARRMLPRLRAHESEERRVLIARIALSISSKALDRRRRLTFEDDYHPILQTIILQYSG